MRHYNLLICIEFYQIHFDKNGLDILMTSFLSSDL